MEEFEIKFLEVDFLKLEEKLLAIGAQKVGELMYKRVLVDYPDWRLDKKHSWLRLRSDGVQTTLTFKERIGVKSNDAIISDDGMKEVEVTVDDYEKTFEILKAIGFIVKREEKNKRVRYVKGDAVFDIDFWPQIPPYLEVESDSLEKAYKAAAELGYKPDDGVVCSGKQIYQKYGFDADDYSSITFEGMIKK